MDSHHTQTTINYRVLVNGDGHHYQSPPQTEQQARSLLAVLIGAELRDHCGPWRQAIADGQQVIELRADP